jgi:hypothetical protein
MAEAEGLSSFVYQLLAFVKYQALSQGAWAPTQLGSAGAAHPFKFPLRDFHFFLSKGGTVGA